jgi:hypothetical protein
MLTVLFFPAFQIKYFDLIERKEMHSFSIFDVEVLMYGDEVAKIDSQVVASNFITWMRPLDVVGAQATKDSVASLSERDRKKVLGNVPNDDGITSE